LGNLLDIIRNIAMIAPPGVILLFLLSYLIGIVFVISAVRMVGKRSEMGPSVGNWGQPVWVFIIGVLFLALPGFLRVVSASLMGGDVAIGDPQNVFSYAPKTIGLMATGEARNIVVALVTVIQVVGVIAVMRGLYFLNLAATSSSNGQRTFGPGIVFVIAGAMAVNFPVFAAMMESLLAPASGN
jgi:hypothetical protein